MEETKRMNPSSSSSIILIHHPHPSSSSIFLIFLSSSALSSSSYILKLSKGKKYETNSHHYYSRGKVRTVTLKKIIIPHVNGWEIMMNGVTMTAVPRSKAEQVEKDQVIQIMLMMSGMKKIVAVMMKGRNMM